MCIVLFDADALVHQACNKAGNKDLEEAKLNFDAAFGNIMSRIEEAYVVVTFSKIFISGRNNYRKFIYPQYKANRPPKPEIIYQLYEWVYEEYNKAEDMEVLRADGCEADDLIAASWHFFSSLYSPDHIVVASVDKDLKQLPCLFFDYYYTRMHLERVSEKESLHCFYRQMITGDTTDNINFTKGIGIQSAEKILEGCTNEFSYRRRVYSFYKQLFKGKARKMYELSYSLLKLNPNVDLPIKKNVL